MVLYYYIVLTNKNLCRTNKKNIQIKIEIPSTAALTDDFIESEVKKIARKISNAYGLPEARCFSYDGSFAWNLMGSFRY